MKNLTVTPVRTEKDLEAFVRFPWKVYQTDPHWVPPLPSDRRKFLQLESNPFFEHGQTEYFLARRNGELVGTIAAISNDLYNEFQEVNDGFFGFFEVMEDEAAAQALFQHAEAWLLDQGHNRVIGPAQFSTNDEVGLLIDGFDDPPRLLMTYNPPRYEGYVEDAGYRKVMDLYAYAVNLQDLRENFPSKVLRVTEKIKKRWNLVVRPVDMREFDQEIEKLKAIYNASWERNWGFVPMTDQELNHLASQLKPFIDPELALFIERDGEVIGFGIGLPDLNQPLLRAYPQPGTPELLTMLKVLWYWKLLNTVDWIRVWALGVLPQYRGMGLDSLLYLELANAAFRKGFQFGEMSWILETNEMMNRGIQVMGGEVYKTYRMYQKPLG